MSARKNAEVNMIDVCLVFLKKKRADIIPFAPAIGDDIDDLIAIRPLISGTQSKAQTSTTGMSKSKKDLRQQIQTTAQGLISAALAYSTGKNNQLTTELKDFDKKSRLLRISIYLEPVIIYRINLKSTSSRSQDAG